MADLCIAVIHGMGSQKPNYSIPMRNEINNRLRVDAPRVEWKEIYWAKILEKREKDYLDEANKHNNLDWIRLRRFMINAFGDASAYRKTHDPNSSAYHDIHEKVRKAIADLDDGSDTPLVVMAHSLGGHIMSNYIYDIQQGRSIVTPGSSDFQQMKTLAGIITFGCNIPFFTLAYKKTDIHPINFPGNALTPVQKNRAKWLNFYDPDDVLGYPLKAINQRYDRVVSEDIAINVGGIFTSWNPIAHQKYWTDNDFTKPVTRFLQSWL